MNEKKLIEFEIKKEDYISNFGSTMKRCLLEKDEELIEKIEKRGKEVPYEFATLAARNCFDDLFKKYDDSEIAIVGTMCSGKSTLWNQFTPKPDITKIRESFYEQGNHPQNLNPCLHIQKKVIIIYISFEASFQFSYRHNICLIEILQFLPWYLSQYY